MNKFFKAFLYVTYPVLIIVVVMLVVARGAVSSAGPANGGTAFAEEEKSEIMLTNEFGFPIINAESLTTDTIAAGDITARSITIVDEAGTPRAVIGLLRNEPGVSIYGPDGTLRISAVIVEDDPHEPIREEMYEVMWVEP